MFHIGSVVVSISPIAPLKPFSKRYFEGQTLLPPPCKKIPVAHLPSDIFID
jgi:hypothetical protein